MTNRPSRARRAARIGVGLALASALAVAFPLAASAHVEVSPGEAAAGSDAVLTFSFHHGCDDSPTTAIRITMPEGLDSVSPTQQAGWAIDVERNADDNLVHTVTFTADEPVPGGIRAALEVDVRFAADAGGKTLAFPVEQSCVAGSTSWSQVAEAGQDPESLDDPAPTVVVGAAAGAEGSGHGDDTGDADAASGGASPLEIAGAVAGIAALLVGSAALVTAGAALRRTRTRR